MSYLSKLIFIMDYRAKTVQRKITSPKQKEAESKVCQVKAR
jgi:hypothetical protein